MAGIRASGFLPRIYTPALKNKNSLITKKFIWLGPYRKGSWPVFKKRWKGTELLKRYV
jgi:hypothetical protein